MRKLHLVGLTTDRGGLIFTARKGSKSGGYIVPLDDKVLDAVAEARNGHPGAPEARSDGRATDRDPDRSEGRVESNLTPREMQGRLRAGRTIDEVASEAGVDSGWVARFAVPILAEQAQVVELSRGLIYAKPRLGDSAQPLNASVIQNLSEKGVFLPDDLADAGWSAFQLHDSVWMVRFRYRSRGRDQEAQWEIDVATGRLQARNRHASDLGYVDGGPRRHAAHQDDDGSADPAGSSPGTQAALPSGPRTRARATSRTRATASRAAAARSVGTRRKAATKPGGATPTPRVAKGPARPVKAAKSVSSLSSAKPARKTAGASRATKAARASKAGTAKTGTAKTGTAKTGTAKTGVVKTGSARRRPARTDAAEVAPAPGTGGVRLAVAQVSTARVAASMASADRAPWATARRGASGTGSRAAAGPPLTSVNGGARPASRRPAAEAVPDDGRNATRAVPTFQPRPLPEGVEIERPRPRRPPSAPRPAVGERPAVVLPAPRIPAPDPAPLPSERPVRRRLRSH